MRKSLVLLINPGAGSVPPHPEDAFIARLQAAASWADVEVHLMEGDFEETVLGVCRRKIDYLAVAGGDGTARAVCEILAGTDQNCAVIPLPLGTANLLPKRLYGERDAEQVLREAKDYGEIRLHAGEVAGKLFFVSAAVGFVTRFAEAREAVRSDGLLGGLGRLWRHSGAGLKAMLSTRLRLRFDGADRRGAKARAVVVSPGGLEALFAPGRAQAGEDRLEVITADPRDIAEVASLGVRALMAKWRDHPRIRACWANRLTVTGRGQLDVMLDGEPYHLDAPIEFTMRSEAVRFLAA